MPSAPSSVVRLSIPRVALVLAGLAWLTVVAMLGVQLAMLEDQRSTVDNQLEVAVTQLREVQPLIRDAKPVVRDAEADRPAARRLTRASLALTREATPVVRELGAVGAGRQLATAGRLAADLERADAAGSLTTVRRLSRTMLDADVGRSLTAVRGLARTLLRADVGGATSAVRRTARVVDGALRTAQLPDTMRSLGAVADELAYRHRLRTLLIRSNRVFAQMEQTAVVPKVSTAAEIVPRLQQLLERSLAIQEELLVIGRDTNGHAASLDRKLGGQVPAATAATP